MSREIMFTMYTLTLRYCEVTVEETLFYMAGGPLVVSMGNPGRRCVSDGEFYRILRSGTGQGYVQAWGLKTAEQVDEEIYRRLRRPGWHLEVDCQGQTVSEDGLPRAIVYELRRALGQPAAPLES